MLLNAEGPQWEENGAAKNMTHKTERVPPHPHKPSTLYPAQTVQGLPWIRNSVKNKFIVTYSELFGNIPKYSGNIRENVRKYLDCKRKILSAAFGECEVGYPTLWHRNMHSTVVAHFFTIRAINARLLLDELFLRISISKHCHMAQT